MKLKLILTTLCFCLVGKVGLACQAPNKDTTPSLSDYAVITNSDDVASALFATGKIQKIEYANQVYTISTLLKSNSGDQTCTLKVTKKFVSSEPPMQGPCGPVGTVIAVPDKEGAKCELVTKDCAACGEMSN